MKARLWFLVAVLFVVDSWTAGMLLDCMRCGADEIAFWIVGFMGGGLFVFSLGMCEREL